MGTQATGTPRWPLSGRIAGRVLPGAAITPLLAGRGLLGYVLVLLLGAAFGALALWLAQRSRATPVTRCASCHAVVWAKTGGRSGAYLQRGHRRTVRKPTAAPATTRLGRA